MFGLSALATKLIAGGLLVLAILGGVFWFIEHERAVGAEEQRDKQAAADALWMKGAVENMDRVQAYYRPYVEALTKAESSRAVLRQDIERKSAANNGMLCVDRAGTSRLRALIGEQPGIRGAVQSNGSPTTGKVR